jgi:hypothetical protein
MSDRRTAKRRSITLINEEFSSSTEEGESLFVEDMVDRLPLVQRQYPPPAIHTAAISHMKIEPAVYQRVY